MLPGLSWLLGAVLQGLAGGLALLCLFMTYIQYATAGREGFLAFYSPQAEVSSSSRSCCGEGRACLAAACLGMACLMRPSAWRYHTFLLFTSAASFNCMVGRYGDTVYMCASRSFVGHNRNS